MSSGTPLFEQLESRTMMAGNVLVTLVGGVLRLQGDAADNVVTLSQDAATVTVTPDATTNVGLGTGNPVTRIGTLKAVSINLGAGSNEVTIDGDSTTGTPFVVPGGVSILTGNGDVNRVTLIGLQCGSLSVAMGNGNNDLVVSALPNSQAASPDIQATVATDFVFASGTGDNDVTIQGVAVGRNATLHMGTTLPVIDDGVSDILFDTFTSNQTFVNTIGKNLTIYGSIGSDDITFANNNGAVGSGMVVGGDVTIRLREGLDSLTADAATQLTVAGNLSIFGGIINKTIVLNSVAAKSLSITTYTGNDTVMVHGAVVDQNMAINTGTGGDFATVDGGALAGGTIIGGSLSVSMAGAAALLGNDPTAVDNPFPLDNLTIGKDLLVSMSGGAASVWAQNLTGRNARLSGLGVGPNVLHDLLQGSLQFNSLTFFPTRGAGAWLIV